MKSELNLRHFPCKIWFKVSLIWFVVYSDYFQSHNQADLLAMLLTLQSDLKSGVILFGIISDWLHNLRLGDFTTREKMSVKQEKESLLKHQNYQRVLTLHLQNKLKRAECVKLILQQLQQSR